MDEIRITNQVELRGVLAGSPQFSHESRGIKFYQFPLEIERLSGTTDTINIVARQDLLDALEVGEYPKLYISGELRSFNNRNGEGSRLVITVYAKEVYYDHGEDVNNVHLTGTICKPATLRTTPMGREICDLMLAVNRRYGRSDYLPCITWGLKAQEASQWGVGTSVVLSGRVQSRHYIKNVDGESVQKTAYEVSVTEISME